MLKELKRWKEAEKRSHKSSEPEIKQKLLHVISSIKGRNQNIFLFVKAWIDGVSQVERMWMWYGRSLSHSSCKNISRTAEQRSKAEWAKKKPWYKSRRGRGKHSRSPSLFFTLRAAKHFSVQCCSTFIAQTNFTRGINMAEILGFYELLHSAGGRVNGVICSARLDLNSLDA